MQVKSVAARVGAHANEGPGPGLSRGKHGNKEGGFGRSIAKQGEGVKTGCWILNVGREWDRGVDTHPQHPACCAPQ